MWETARHIVTESVRDLFRLFRSVALTDIAYKLVAFALLTPGVTLLLRWFAFSDDTQVIADVEIATFFLTTPTGVVTLIGGGTLIGGITALEMACLMAIGMAAARGRRLNARDALAFGVARSPHVLRLAMNMVGRLLVGLLPFLLVAGLTYWVLLRYHDINYYLTARPPALWAAAAIAAVLLTALAALLVRTVARWAIALPLVLFENVSPRRALGESSRRMLEARPVVVVVLLSWAILAIGLAVAATWAPEVIGRSLAPMFTGSLALLLLFIMGLALLWAACGLIAGIVNIALLALALVTLYLRIGSPQELQVPGVATSERSGAAGPITRSARAGVAAVGVLGVVGFVLIAVVVAGRNQPVVVIAHRGAAAAAPENTLAAFRLAGDQRADFVELDVQESADGEVLVVHDSDLMRVSGHPLRIWEVDAARLRAVDVGSHAGSHFSGERVPTLAEALAVCKGRSRVIVELKSYGHDQRLEEKVVAIVEAAGMANDTLFMSLDHGMVRRIKQLRPSWRSGVLVATALGDLTSLGADFIAVEARLATRSLVRQAHRAGQEVYVWTLNDPAWMLVALSHGVDGLITDKPDLARVVVARRASMSVAERILVALLVRLGARTEALEAEDALRP